MEERATRRKEKRYIKRRVNMENPELFIYLIGRKRLQYEISEMWSQHYEDRCFPTDKGAVTQNF